MSGYGVRLPEWLAGDQHCMHDDGEFAGYRDGCSLEAEPLSQLQPPFAQITFGSASSEQHGCGLVEQPSQVAVATSGDMPVMVDLAGLIAAGRQPDPGTHGS